MVYVVVALFLIGLLLLSLGVSTLGSVVQRLGVLLSEKLQWGMAGLGLLMWAAAYFLLKYVK
jgi:hypothetical protein